MAKSSESELLVVEGRDIAISNPRKVLVPEPGYTRSSISYSITYGFIQLLAPHFDRKAVKAALKANDLIRLYG
jgi:hypothetical protein